MKNHKIIAIKIIITLAILIILIYSIIIHMGDRIQTNTKNNLNQSSLIANNENKYSGKTSTNDYEINENNTNNIINNNNYNNNSYNNNTTKLDNENLNAANNTDNYVWNGERLPNREDEPVISDTGANSDYYNDSIQLEKINQDLAKLNATTFVNGFFTYSKDSIVKKAYQTSFSSVLSSNMSNDIKKQISDDNLTILAQFGAVSTTKLVTVKDIYISHLTNENSIAVRLEAQIYRNQGSPGEQDWKVMQDVKESISVYLDNNYKVTDYRVTSVQTL